jgi:hypothetical protein
MGRIGKIGWIALGAAAGVMIYLLLVQPVIGLADSGDFMRIMNTVGLSYLDPGAPFRDQFFGYLHTQFAFTNMGTGGYVSTEIIVVWVAVLLNKLLHPHVFDIRFLSSLYILLTLVVFACILRLKLLASTTAKLVCACLFILIFLDIGYLSYYNSFFGEPISLIFLLLTIVLALHLTEQTHPRKALFFAFLAAAIFLIGSKVQNAPIGLIICLLCVRFLSISSKRSWKNSILVSSALLLVFSLAIYVSAPKELRVINQYQSVFYGILKDSPTPEQDLQSLGLDPKLAVLAGTNYFTPNTPIPQQSEELKRAFYSKISHAKIAIFYAKHPGRYWDKLQVTAKNASTVRPSYLGNYEKAVGYEYGKISSTFDTWSVLKSTILPHSLWFLILIYLLYYVTLFRLHRNEPHLAKRKTYEVFGAIGLIGVVSFLVPLLGDGEADMEKHLFLFSVCFDLMLLISITWLIHQAVKIVSRRVS